MHRHPREPMKVPDQPFPSEEEMAQAAARVLKEQRRDGGLPMEPVDAPVKNDKPYKNLKSY